ncbi:MAG: hypothetical protein M1820_008734 [Bogoriella megaspora]|nr:MAG: hypothetical protein M1820_008734 [Bogoriella megaspora]
MVPRVAKEVLPSTLSQRGEPVESVAQSSQTDLDDLQSTISAADQRALNSDVFPPSLQHADLPKKGEQSGPSTTTKSAPQLDHEDSSGSVSTDPTSVTEASKQEQEDDPKRVLSIQEQIILEHPEDEEGDPSRLPLSLKVAAGERSQSDGTVVSSIPSKRSSTGTGKVNFSPGVKDPPTSSVPGAIELPGSNNAVQQSIEPLKRASTGSTSLSSNKAEVGSGSDRSSYRSSGSLAELRDMTPSQTLLGIGTNQLPTTAPPFETVEADMQDISQPVVDASGKDGVSSTEISPVDAQDFHPRSKNQTVSVEKTSVQKRERKRWNRQKVIITGLALVAMSTIILRPRVPSA